jgi:hypothetical protein
VVIWDQWNNTEAHYLPVGEYCLIVDLDGDGVYSEGVDVIDAMNIGYMAGVSPQRGPEPRFNMPELPLGSLAAVLAFLMAALLVRTKKTL